jgi:hypothetical protein
MPVLHALHIVLGYFVKKNKVHMCVNTCICESPK